MCMIIGMASSRIDNKQYEVEMFEEKSSGSSRIQLNEFHLFSFWATEEEEEQWRKKSWLEKEKKTI